MIALVAFIFGILANPELQVNWSGRDSNVVRVMLRGEDGITGDCIGSGLELRYRYEFRFCKRVALWFDACGPVRRENHQVQFDPVRQTYRYWADRLDDQQPPEQQVYSSVDDALKRLRTVEALPLQFLATDFEAKAATGKAYLDARVLTQCRGEYDATLARISYVLSLGLVRTSGYDSGWIQFPMAVPTPNTAR